MRLRSGLPWLVIKDDERIRYYESIRGFETNVFLPLLAEFPY